MFKNPIKKYQSGGVTPSQEEQQMLQAFIEWLPKRVKEFANMQPEQIVEALNGMGKTQEGQKQVQAYIQQFQQELQGQQAGMFKDGGKLQDFICKHAKGGKAGCGCKEDGGKVEKAQLGTTAPTYLYDENGYPVEMNERTSRDGRVLIQETPTSVGEAMHLFNSLSANADGYAFPIEYNMQRLHMLGDGAMSVQPIRGFERDLESQKINRWKTSNTQPNPDAKENGGVVKGQGGLAKIGKAVVNAAKSARKTGTYVPEQAIGKPFFGNAVRFSKSISPERYRAVINWRLANDPNYKLSLDSMERAMQSMGNTDIAYDLYRLKNFGATNKAEFLQFEDAMNRGLNGTQFIDALKPRTTDRYLYGGGGNYAKTGEQMVFNPYVNFEFKQGGNIKPAWINRIKK